MTSLLKDALMVLPPQTPRAVNEPYERGQLVVIIGQEGIYKFCGMAATHGKGRKRLLLRGVGLHAAHSCRANPDWVRSAD